jgi:hypothetical protein
MLACRRHMAHHTKYKDLLEPRDELLARLPADGRSLALALETFATKGRGGEDCCCCEYWYPEPEDFCC